MDDGESRAAAQLSQTDIIEHQAQTIARLQRHVEKGKEYKQLTKSKLKEAAARLKAYRLRIETLLETETRCHQPVVPRVPVSVHHVATQTDATESVTRASQTETVASCKNALSLDQAPRFFHETSAELDAALAKSDSEDETKDATLLVSKAMESDAKSDERKRWESSEWKTDAMVAIANEIEQELLEASSEEETTGGGIVTCEEKAKVCVSIDDEVDEAFAGLDTDESSGENEVPDEMAMDVVTEKKEEDQHQEMEERLSTHGQEKEGFQTVALKSVQKDDLLPKKRRKVDDAQVNTIKNGVKRRKGGKRRRQGSDAQWLDSVSKLTHAIKREANEIDRTFTRRTLTALAKQSVPWIESHRPHVLTLCHLLAERYQELNVAPQDLLYGALDVFRTPRTRRVLPQTKCGLAWLYTQVFLQFATRHERVDQSQIDEWLDALTSLLFPNQRDGTTKQVAHGYTEPVFLAHCCTLVATLCHATQQRARARIVLFDLMCNKPSLCGFYYATNMIEVYPAILEHEFDAQCLARPSLVKDTLLETFLFIAKDAAAKKDVVVHESGVTLLHRVADAMEMPELIDKDATRPETWVEHLLARFRTLSVDFFELGKCLELCVAVYGFEIVGTNFPIATCQSLFWQAPCDKKGGIVTIVGAIAQCGALARHRTQKVLPWIDQYIATVLAWLDQLLSNEPIDLELRVATATVAVELLLADSAPATLESRQRVMAAILKWFNATPSAQLMELPAPFLRRLRFAVVAARPLQA